MNELNKKSREGERHRGFSAPQYTPRNLKQNYTVAHDEGVWEGPNIPSNRIAKNIIASAN